jgi:hypothetical protein
MPTKLCPCGKPFVEVTALIPKNMTAIPKVLMQPLN